MVKDTYADMDLIGLTIPADEKIGPGDRWILENVRKVAPTTPILGIVTKVDKVSRDQVAAQLMAVHDLLGESSEIVPVSAVTGEQRDVLIEVITSLLPEGPKFYPDDHITDDDTETRIAELVREAALSGLKDELPHSVAVEVDEIIPNEDRPGVMDVHVVIYVERPGQKEILIGKGGRRIGRIIHNARPQICELLGTNVYLDLRIKVLKNWQSDPKQLGRLGF